MTKKSALGGRGVEGGSIREADGLGAEVVDLL